MTEQPKKNSKFVQCWNCGGYIGRKILKNYDNNCPLCEATEVDDGVGTAA